MTESVQVALIAGLAPALLVVVTAMVADRRTHDIAARTATELREREQVRAEQRAVSEQKLDQVVETTKVQGEQATVAATQAVAAADKAEVIHKLVNSRLTEEIALKEQAQRKVDELTAEVQRLKGAGR